MKLQLFASTAAVLFSAFSGSVSATSLRGVSATSDAVDSSDYYPEVEYYDSDSADYYPESGDYDFDYEDDEEEDPDDVDFVSNNGYNRARARQQARRFGINSGRSGSNRAHNTNRARLERNGIIRSSGSSRAGTATAAGTATVTVSVPSALPIAGSTQGVIADVSELCACAHFLLPPPPTLLCLYDLFCIAPAPGLIVRTRTA
mmetsp:Transcript_29035/g.49512  ORF Transcript_29035/g.49512 Transcript_29035/m.49512 type:complete len:203 (-) Transcript_29035:37-645(-)